MDCRVLRHLMLKSDGNLACDDSAGYQINITQVSKLPFWNFTSVLTSPIYAHIRRSFAQGHAPWPGVCENCDLFSPAAEPSDSLDTRFSLQVEPTLACALKCPSCNRTRETRLRDPDRYDLDPEILASLLRSVAANGIVVPAIEYIGWGEPLDHPKFAELTQIARTHCPSTHQTVHTNGNVDAATTIGSCALDRITVSCDGATPESYVKYRRQGKFDMVLTFLADVKRLRPDIELQWKYIVFDWNDTDEETNRAQDLADELGVDSMLFVLTNSKGRSQRYSAETLHLMPIRHPRAIARPAAATEGVIAPGVIVGGGTFADEMGNHLRVDRANWLRSGVLEVAGWAAGPRIDLAELTCRVDDSAPYPVIERLTRTDVWEQHPELPREPYGFVFHLPGAHGRDLVTLTFSLDDERFRHVGLVNAGPTATREGVAESGTITAGRKFAGASGDRLVVEHVDWLRSGILEIRGWATGPRVALGALTCRADDGDPYPVAESQTRPDVWEQYPELPHDRFGFVFSLPGTPERGRVTLTFSTESPDGVATRLGHSVTVEAQLAASPAGAAAS